MQYVVAVLVLIVAYVVWAKVLRRPKPRGQGWGEISDSLGFVFHPGKTGQYPMMRGKYRDIEFRISSEKIDSAHGRADVTKIVAFLDFPTPEGLFIARHRMLGALERIFEIEHVELDDFEIDSQLLIKATWEDDVVRLFSDVTVRESLLALFDTYPTAQLSAMTLSLSLPGVARDSRGLKQALQDLAALVDYLETALACEETERISEARRSSTPPPAPEIQFTPTDLPTFFDSDLDLKGPAPTPEEEDEEAEEGEDDTKADSGP